MKKRKELNATLEQFKNFTVLGKIHNKSKKDVQ